METIGYRILEKFPALKVKEDIPGGASKWLDERLPDLHALLLYHGQPEPQMFHDLATRSKAKQLAVLIVATHPVSRPADLPQSPYLYLYSVGVRNSLDESDLLTPLFQALVDHFETLTQLPDENSIRSLWESVDPVSDLFERVELLEQILLTGPETLAGVPDVLRERLTNLFPSLHTIADLREEYLRLCQTGDVKKKRTGGI